MFLYVVPVLVLAALVVLAATVKILREYERAVVFTLGRFQRVRGPGLVLLLPSSRKWFGSICAFASSRSPART